MKDFLPTLDEARTLIGPLVPTPLDDDAVMAAFAAAAWSCLVEPGDRVAGRVVASLGAWPALVETVESADSAHTAGVRAGHEAIAHRIGVGEQDWRDALVRWRPRIRRQGVRDAAEVAARARVRLVTPADDAWPRAIDELGDHAPLCLWARGRLDVLGSSVASVAVVGARAATGYGEHVAMELAAELAGRGVTIVSGAAYGIDGMAHRAALNAGGTTIALLAGGADRPYPAGHAQLIERIAASGAVVSEVPCGAAPTKWRFLQRNRLIAARADATVVVEAGWRSGSLNTAGHASALGRPLGAVPGPVTSATSAGCHRLLREFGAACVTRADDVVEMLPILHGGAGPIWQATAGTDAAAHGGQDRRATDDSTRVTDALSSRSHRAAADVARRAGMSAQQAEAILGLLELEGVARRDSEGWRRIPSA